MNMNDRASVALTRLRSGTTDKARPTAEHGLALALETMFDSGDSRCLLTTTEIERYIGSEGSHNGSRVIRRVLDSGALVEVSDPAAVETFRTALNRPSIPANARVVTLPDVPSEGGERSQVKEAPAPSHRTQVVPSEGEIALYLLPLWGVSSCNTTREYVAAMSPRSSVWNGNTLGSHEARVYAVVSSAGKPVTASVVRAELDAGLRRVKRDLQSLRDHRLIVRAPDDSGWVPGPVTPTTHTPADCPGCRSKVPEPVQSPQAATQPREGATVNDCPDCLMWNEHGLTCPCSDSPAMSLSAQPATTAGDRAPTLIGWDDQGSELYSIPDHDYYGLSMPNGHTGKPLLSRCFGHTGAVRMTCSVQGIAPDPVWTAYLAYRPQETHHDSHYRL